MEHPVPIPRKKVTVRSRSLRPAVLMVLPVHTVGT